MRSIRVYDDAIGQGNGRSEIGPIPVAPLNTPLVNSIIRAFGLAGAAVDAVVGDANSHTGKETKNLFTRGFRNGCGWGRSRVFGRSLWR